MEFHAVVFCGKGPNLSPFSKVRQSGKPAALIPIFNKPVIEYVLEWCDKAFFNKITVISDTESKDLIQDVINKYLNKRVDSIDEDAMDIRLGPIELLVSDAESTGDVLFSIKDKISSDFVILPCDFITDLPPQVLIEAYRNRCDSDLALSFHYENTFKNIDKKVLVPNYTIYTNLDDGHSQLLDVYPTTIESNKSLEIRTQMVWRYPNSIISAKILDASIYFCSRKVLSLFPESASQKPISKLIRDLARRSWRHSVQRDTIGLFILPTQCTFIRNDNLPIYMESNRWLMKKQAANNHGNPATTTKDKLSPTIGADSLVEADSVLGERTSVKRSVIGSRCQIGKRCRITGCIILDGVVLGDDVVVENCIIGYNVSIFTKSKLINCYLENNYKILKRSDLKNETVLDLSLEEFGMDSDGAIYSSSDDDDEDDDDEDDYSEEYDDEFEDDDGLFDR